MTENFKKKDEKNLKIEGKRIIFMKTWEINVHDRKIKINHNLEMNKIENILQQKPFNVIDKKS